MKAIQKKTNELKSAIDRKADAMRRRIQLSSVEQMRKLDGVLQSVKAKSITGHILKLDMENRPHNNKPQAIQHIVKLKQRVANFQISSEEERNKMVDYAITSFKPDTNQFFQMDKAIHYMNESIRSIINTNLFLFSPLSCQGEILRLFSSLQLRVRSRSQSLKLLI